jgi:hypothetical protein
LKQKKIERISVNIIVIDIRTRYLPHTNARRYRNTNLLINVLKQNESIYVHKHFVIKERMKSACEVQHSSNLEVKMSASLISGDLYPEGKRRRCPLGGVLKNVSEGGCGEKSPVGFKNNLVPTFVTHNFN